MNRLVLYLRRDGVAVFDSKDRQVKAGNFESGIIAGMEIVDEEKFKLALAAILGKMKAKYDIIVDNDLLFAKKIAVNDNLSQELKQFLEEIPLEEQRKSWLAIKKKDLTLLLATNNSFYKLAVETLTKLGCKVGAVLPIQAFPEGETARAVQNRVIDTIVGNKNMRSIYSFVVNDSPNKQVKKVRPMTMVLLVILILVAGLGGGVYLVKRPQKTQAEASLQSPVVSMVSATPTENPELTPSVWPKQKEEISVVVMNSSGIPGLAGKVALALQEAGFVQATATNSSEKRQESLIEYPDAEFIEEIASVIQPVVGSMETKMASGAANINIILGQDLR